MIEAAIRPGYRSYGKRSNVRPLQPPTPVIGEDHTRGYQGLSCQYPRASLPCPVRDLGSRRLPG